MHLFKIPVKSPILKMSDDLLFCNLLHHEDHISSEMCWENSFKKTLWLKIMIFTFFFFQNMYDFQATTKRCSHILYQQAKITLWKLFQQYLRFTGKNANKNVAFLNVLSVYVVLVSLPTLFFSTLSQNINLLLEIKIPKNRHFFRFWRYFLCKMF